MKAALLLFAMSVATIPVTVSAAPEKPAAVAQLPSAPVTVEYYYRIKWGSYWEFKELYERNHQPLLDEMKRLGFITKVESATPFTHMAGGPRWDFRTTITFRGAEDAVGDGTGYEAKEAEFSKKLFPDRKKYLEEETRRFALLEEHWDVIVITK